VDEVKDMATRMAEASSKKENPLETEGMILIDEVDLHLHSGWHIFLNSCYINS